MNLRFFPAAATLGCVLLASCYPYPERNGRRTDTNPPKKQLTAAEEAKLKEQRQKDREEARKKEELVEKPVETTGPNTDGGTTTPPPEPPRRTDYPVATKVPGRDGYVLSPYNNKVISVKDDQDKPLASGTLVQDPTYPPGEKKYFRVP